VKIIADYTSLLLLRHPNEMGGLYFSINTLVGQLQMWAGIILHNRKHNPRENEEMMMDDDDDDVSLDVNELVLMGRVLSVIWIASSAIILLKCERKYRRTF
jgi:hypothetical protein